MSIKTLSRALAVAGVSITTHADHIRASIHATTTQASIDLLLEALR
jgi:selenocysteine lyase/cysteine desulfurase